MQESGLWCTEQAEASYQAFSPEDLICTGLKTSSFEFLLYCLDTSPTNRMWTRGPGQVARILQMGQLFQHTDSPGQVARILQMGQLFQHTDNWYIIHFLTVKTCSTQHSITIMFIHFATTGNVIIYKINSIHPADKLKRKRKQSLNRTKPAITFALNKTYTVKLA
ncbi:hypothetical protein ACOMHN_034602 [Nucella lapillus]